MWWRFSNTIDRADDVASQGIKVTQRFSHRNKQRGIIFTWKINLGKITGRRERIQYFQKGTVNLVELYSIYILWFWSRFNSLGFNALVGWRFKRINTLRVVTEGANIMNLHNSMVCTLGFLCNYWDYAIDCGEWFLLSSVTVRTGAKAVAMFKTWDDLAT